ncbi:MAG TPA: carboxymuconolactone decarboxylase family protein [Jatrophihabitans sp.]|jgi:alkylhydroperoxidase family enzyme|nr:carboxymuconolactone decarboxylase family protein [Jatrophihabitans sp.]
MANVTESVTRIAPLSPPYEPEVAEQLARMMPAGAEPIGLFRVFARNLPMARAMFSLGHYQLGRQLSLSLREREIVIVRTCALCRCEYEWGVHVAFFAGRAGFDAAQLRSLTHGDAADACWADPRERLLIRAVDALYRNGDLDDDLWLELRGTFGEAHILDVVLLCGWYQAISTLARTARLANEPGAPTFASVG